MNLCSSIAKVFASSECFCAWWEGGELRSLGPVKLLCTREWTTALTTETSCVWAAVQVCCKAEVGAS